MGKVHLAGQGGNASPVDKTKKFVKDDAGQLRIALHHSLLEYSGKRGPVRRLRAPLRPSQPAWPVDTPPLKKLRRHVDSVTV